MYKEEVNFPLSILTIMTHKTDPNQFCLRIKPKYPKETDTQMMMVIHNNPMWFSWKYDIIHTPALNRLENEWRIIADVLEIKQKPFLCDDTKDFDVYEKHMRLYFRNRRKRLFSTKFDVCCDIFRQLRDHSDVCCDEIVSVVQNVKPPPETVYWIGGTSPVSNKEKTDSEK